MIKIFIIITSIIAPLISYAQITRVEGSLNNFLGIDSVSELIAIFVDWIINLGIIALTLYFIYTGFQFVAARGNPEQIETAKKSFMWTVIGALLLIGAKVLVEVLKNTLGAAGI